MFKDPFHDEDADTKALAGSEELSTAQTEHTAAQETTNTLSRSSNTNKQQHFTVDPPTPPRPALRTSLSSRRNFDSTLTDLPRQIMTPEEIDATQTALQAERSRTYEPSRAAHTAFYLVQLNGFQSANDTQPPGSTHPNNTTVARILRLPSPSPVLDTDEIESLLYPVQAELERLKGTKLPPQTGRVQATSATQVLKERLLPVGRSVVQSLQNIDKERRGAVEGSICQYIAKNYWPQQLVHADRLRVMETYRNAIFLERIEYEQSVAEETSWNTEIAEGLLIDGVSEDDVPGLLEEYECNPDAGQKMWKPEAGEEVWRLGVGKQVWYYGAREELWSPKVIGEEVWVPGEMDELEYDEEEGGVSLFDDELG